MFNSLIEMTLYKCVKTRNIPSKTMLSKGCSMGGRDSRAECWLWNSWGLRIIWLLSMNLNLTRISWLWDWVKTVHALNGFVIFPVCVHVKQEVPRGDALFEKQQEKERQLRLRRSAEGNCLGSRGCCRASLYPPVMFGALWSLLTRC